MSVRRLPEDERRLEVLLRAERKMMPRLVVMQNLELQMEFLQVFPKVVGILVPTKGHPLPQVNRLRNGSQHNRGFVLFLGQYFAASSESLLAGNAVDPWINSQ